MEFGDILKQLRLDRDLSQDELASLLGTTKQVISRYETKKRIPRLSVVADYAQKLGLPLSALSGEQAALPTGAMPVGGRRRVPILGSAACAEPMAASFSPSCCPATRPIPPSTSAARMRRAMSASSARLTPCASIFNPYAKRGHPAWDTLSFLVPFIVSPRAQTSSAPAFWAPKTPPARLAAWALRSNNPESGQRPVPSRTPPDRSARCPPRPR